MSLLLLSDDWRLLPQKDSHNLLPPQDNEWLSAENLTRQTHKREQGGLNTTPNPQAWALELSLLDFLYTPTFLFLLKLLWNLFLSFELTVLRLSWTEHPMTGVQFVHKATWGLNLSRPLKSTRCTYHNSPHFYSFIYTVSSHQTTYFL